MHHRPALPGVFYGWWVVIASVVIYATFLGSHQSFAVFFKPIQTEFGWSRTVTATAFLVGGLAVAFLSPVIGALSDRYGPRRVITAIGLSSAIGYSLLSQVQVQWQFFGAFVLESSGMAFWVPLQTMVSRWFTQRRGLALGLTGIGGGIGQALYPPFAQYLIDRFDWRNAYIVLAGTMVVVVMSATQVLRGSPEDKGLRPYGEPEIRGDGPFQSPQAGAPAFRIKEALRTRAFWMILVGCGFGSVTLQMVWVHLAPYVTDPGIGASSLVGATLLSIIGWSNLAGKVVLGGISDRIGARATLVICYGMAGLAMVWLVVARELWMLYAFAGALGFFYGGWIPMQAALVGSVFGLASMGAVLGGIQTGTQAAGASGALLGGYVFDRTGSYQVAFLIGAGLFFTATMLVLLVRKPRLRVAENSSGAPVSRAA
ncbi:MAG: MFS transporter [Chloroflexi bacterium]|nr:MFS transporter [Chloroflexota bacterium]